MLIHVRDDHNRHELAALRILSRATESALDFSHALCAADVGCSFEC